MKTLEQIQKEVSVWSQRNFGAQPSWKPLLGLVEEYVELLDAIQEMSLEKYEDAIGDIGIYLCDFCGREKIPFTDDDRIRVYMCPTKKILFSLGSLSHAFLKKEQTIRVTEKHNEVILENTREILSCLWSLKSRGKDFLTILNETWEVVSKRDWTKNKDNGQL